MDKQDKDLFIGFAKDYGYDFSGFSWAKLKRGYKLRALMVDIHDAVTLATDFMAFHPKYHVVLCPVGLRGYNFLVVKTVDR